MNLPLTLLALFAASIGTFLFSTLTYALREFSRAALSAWLEERNRGRFFEPTVAAEEELALGSAVARLACNLAVVLLTLHLTRLLLPDAGGAAEYAIAFGASIILIAIVGVALPFTLATHAAEPFIGFFIRLLHIKRYALWPVVKLFDPLDRGIRRLLGHGPADDPEDMEEEFEQEILDIVEEGREEGVIGPEQRDMIQRAIRFNDTTAGQVMTARPEVVGIPADADADTVLREIDESGFSRMPVYEGNLDKIVGILYARDLFRFVGKRLNGKDNADGTVRRFDVREIMRPALFVPETKQLHDLLRQFKLSKVHMAIVLDEYGGTAGVITIEDVLEELVGEIADEHEDEEPPLVLRLDEHVAEADARVEIEEVNRVMGLKLPEEEAYETLAGFVTTTLGRIPQAGTTFEHEAAGGTIIFEVLDAEPQRVNRVRIEFRPASLASPTPTAPADAPNASATRESEAPAEPVAR